MTTVFRRACAALVLGGVLAGAASAQWTNRYPKVDGFGHHVYLEGHEFPSLTSGPIDPAPAPDGTTIAYADSGFIWLLDTSTGVATRETASRDVDSRPQWSPDGSKLVFIRDNGADTSIVVRMLATGAETVINTPTIELDPTFAHDGQSVYFTSGQGGTLNIWRHYLATGLREQVTDLEGVERGARILHDGSGIVYVHFAGFSEKHLRFRSFTKGTDTALYSTGISAHLMADTHPSEHTVVAALPEGDSYRLHSMDVYQPDYTSELTPKPNDGSGDRYTLRPAWSSDGQHIYFSEPDANQQFHLKRTSAFGGAVEDVDITTKNWGEDRHTVTLRTVKNRQPSPARLSVLDARGHPVVPAEGPVYFDGESGVHYFYSSDTISLEVPVGPLTITAVNGIMTKANTQTIDLGADRAADITLSIPEVWDAAGAGYASADYHFHLNYDGPFRMVPDDLKPLLDGENLTVGASLLANLHTRLMDRLFLGERVTTKSGNVAHMGQEVRSHLHGHVGLVNVDAEYRPWHWGPRSIYPRLAEVDRSNGEVLDFAKKHNALATYVHPVAKNVDPFLPENLSGIPLEFVSDAILTDGLALEIICAWTDELGTSELWYRLLNIGKPIIAVAGTDSFADFHRTPAMGSARVYAHVGDQKPTWDSVLAKVRAGESFVSNAPALMFTVDGDTTPGGVVTPGRHTWSVELTSAVAVETLEIVVNGAVVWSGEGVGGGEAKTYEGTVDLPAGGWVAARAHGGDMAWPGMDSYAFAHTSPLWIGRVGSTDPAAEAAAKADLRRALTHMATRTDGAYGEQDLAKMKARIQAAMEAIKE